MCTIMKYPIHRFIDCESRFFDFVQLKKFYLHRVPLFWNREIFLIRKDG
jgi:hypothetical protein